MSIVPTTPFKDQKPGTSGLRKKVTVFQQPNYLANFVQATFNVLRASSEGVPDVLVVGGDGRYFGKDACQLIVKIAGANGVKRVWIGENGLLSTPAVSAIVRNREGGIAKGAFILTASHNPGGPTEDFGIKYNAANGGPAQEKLTNLIYQETLVLQSYAIRNDIPEVELSKCGVVFKDPVYEVEIISSTDDYVALLESIFDFKLLQRLLSRKDFTFIVDAMHGVAGPYATRVFVEMLGASPTCLLNASPKEDFGQGHPDPNLTYAHELVEKMGLRSDGTVADDAKCVPSFGAAFDGDADRNMILGHKFFVTPSDSVALIAANSTCIPFFAKHGGVRSVARSMPTSGALDRVAQALEIKLAEVPTGWKFFGNLMDSKEVFGGEEYNPLICGEESFGTGSNHVREKDGLWAVLSWLSIISKFNSDSNSPFVSVQKIVEEHWKTYGRNYYCRYDYEGVASESADKVMSRVRAFDIATIPALGSATVVKIDDFEYTDPVDGSVSPNQGIRVLFSDGSRFVLRLSGTGSSGATIRLYMEQFMTAEEVASNLANGTLPSTSSALGDLVKIALLVSDMENLTGRSAPTVIT